MRCMLESRSNEETLVNTEMKQSIWSKADTVELASSMLADVSYKQ
jgi:hypothetical protein